MELTGRNKRSLAMDISTEEGYATLCHMLKQADVFVVNFSAATLERYKLTWDILKEINPRLIFAQISAYGLEGPDAEKRAFDLTGWFARTGIMDLMQHQDMAPPPPAGGVGDHATGMTLFAGVMMALYKRELTGEGSMIATSLAATGTWANGLNLQGTIAGIDGARRRDKEGWSNPFTNVYTCADGRHLMVGVQNIKRDWPKLAKVLGHPEWLEQDDMSSVKGIMKNRFAAKQRISEAFLAIGSADLCQALEEAGIVHSLVAHTTEVIEDEQLIANGVIVDSNSGKPGFERTFATPIQLSNEPQRPPGRAPDIGEHSETVLQEFGLNQAQIDSLIHAGVVAQAGDPPPS